MLNIFIGYDKIESVAYHVLSHSILSRATAPVSITPLNRDHFPYFTRKRGPLESTDFSISRFLVPYLSGYQGYSLFMDCDMLLRVPVNEIWQDLSPSSFKYTAVWVCPHEYVPKSERKMQDQAQTTYARKNWSSFMFFNNSECRILTPDYVNSTEGLTLHQFAWLSPDQIGSLPLEWNWLVGEYDKNPHARNYHYTLGGPWFSDHRRCDHSEEWLAEYRDMTGQDFRPHQVWQVPKTLIRPVGEGNPKSHGECK